MKWIIKPRRDESSQWDLNDQFSLVRWASSGKFRLYPFNDISSDTRIGEFPSETPIKEAKELAIQYLKERLPNSKRVGEWE